MLNQRDLQVSLRKWLPLFLVLFFGSLMMEQLAAASPLKSSFSPVDDTYVRSGFSFAKKNFGREPVLEIQNAKGAVSEAYLKFDLAGIDRNIKEAKLKLYASAETAEPATVQVRSVGTTAWLENTVTWKQKPEPMGEMIGTFQTTGSSAAWYVVDLTALLKRELAAGNETVSFALTLDESSNNKISVASREAEANGPVIAASRNIVSTKIVFQPRTRPAPAGYLIDSGEPFGPRGNSGLSFGWSTDITKYVNDRTVAPAEEEAKPVKGPDNRYMGVAFMDHSEMKSPASWEIAVPNGKYKVHVVAGDASYYDSIFAIDVEDVLIIDGIPDTNKRWVEGAQIITVTDGKLTIHNHTKGINNKLCFVELAELTAP